MVRKIGSGLCVLFLVLGLLVAPSPAAAQSGGDDGGYYLGSGILTLLYFPVKLVTCGTGAVVTSLAYVATYDVPGSHDGGTNGKDIGEVARRSCGGAWVIRPEQVKEDYQ
jgi:hypothetical protein